MFHCHRQRDIVIDGFLSKVYWHILSLLQKTIMKYFTCFYFPKVTRVDMYELRRQQIRIGLIKASRVLLKHQVILRQILTQEVLLECQHPEPDTNTSDDEITETPNMILQQVMMMATQPSPLKAIFSQEELEVSKDS